MKTVDQVIITGADGFVGSHTAACFLQNGVRVLALDRAQTPQRLTAAPGLTYLPCDVFDREAMLRQIPRGAYDAFLHFAWAGSSGAERADYSLQMQNALHTAESVKTAKALGCRRFVGAGSIMEYEAEAALRSCGSRPGMGYMYGMAKHAAHGMGKAVAADIGIEFVWPMITNAYGAGELSPRFVNTTLRKLLRGERLCFTSAMQHYDFVYVTDVARAFYLITGRGKPFCTYMIGSGGARSLRAFIQELISVCAPEAEAVFGSVPFTGISLPINAFDTADTERDCGFRAEISFAEGIKRTLNWLKTLEAGGERHDTAV